MTKSQLLAAISPFPDDAEIAFDLRTIDSDDFAIHRIESVEIRGVKYSEDLEEIKRSGVIWLSVYCNGMPPVSVGTENPFNAPQPDFG